MKRHFSRCHFDHCTTDAPNIDLNEIEIEFVIKKIHVLFFFVLLVRNPLEEQEQHQDSCIATSLRRTWWKNDEFFSLKTNSYQRCPPCTVVNRRDVSKCQNQRFWSHWKEEKFDSNIFSLNSLPSTIHKNISRFNITM